MLNVRDGIIQSPRVNVRIYPSLEHGELKTVSGLIVHQTSNNFISKTTIQYLSGQKTGTHFLIGFDGSIIQTARISQICRHVGFIRSRCQVLHTCSPAEKKSYESIEKDNNKHEAQRLIYKNESTKTAPQLFPMNEDSIGIEVVGAPKTSKSGDLYYGAGTMEQDIASTWLVKELVSTIILRGDEIYSNGVDESLFLDKKGKPVYDQVLSHSDVRPHKTSGEGNQIGRW